VTVPQSFGAGPVVDDPVRAARGSIGPSLRDVDFERLREYVYRRTGIQFTTNKRYFVDKRVHAMMTDYGTDDFATYFSALRLGEESLVQKLVNELTVNETYFLREDYQFECLIRSVLPQVMADRADEQISDEPIKILSLPSSTGEEPYSIAIRLLEEWPLIDSVDVTLIAGDIDTRVLAAARTGAYGLRSLQRLPEALLRKYFEPIGSDCHQVVEDLRSAVDFRQLNINDVDAMQAYRGFDVIFCRNLLIYFDELSCRTAVENLFGVLRPGGFVFLGHSESMSRISPIFTPRRFPEGIAYQRPKSGDRR
jgi:chemotaxis protein methyltransferase CheR